MCIRDSYQITTATNTVYVIDEDGRTVSHTMENRPDRILQSVGLGALAAGDPGLGEISGHYVLSLIHILPLPRPAPQRDAARHSDAP